jgi:PAS domain-containing protein
MEMSEGTLIVDQHGDVRFCSTSLARVLGKRPMDLAGRPIWSLLLGWTPFDCEHEPSSLAGLRAADGSEHAVRVACEVLHVAGGRLFVMEIQPASS